MVTRLTTQLTLILFTAVLVSGCAGLVNRSTNSSPVEEDPGSRTMGEVIDDNSIETKVKVALWKADARYEESRLRVFSHNGNVLLVGQLPEETLLPSATEIAAAIRKVKTVHNKLTVGKKISAGVRANDSWLGVKVKSRMFTTDYFPSRKVHVVTENGVVYLMGLVSKEVGAQAAQIATEVNGVQQVVTLFEYVEN